MPTRSPIVGALLRERVPPARHALTVPLERVRGAALWLLLAASSLVLIEPSPYEALFVVAVVVFGTGLKLDVATVPLVVCLTALIVGVLIALMPWTDDRLSVIYAATSAYMAITTVFFASVVGERTAERLLTIRRGYLVAAALCSIAGILGYFNVGGLSAIFTKYERATGTFKDPNVLGPFLVLPIVWAAQSYMLNDTRRGLLARAALGATFFLMVSALFLTFSRGAWGACVGSLALSVAMTFFTTTSRRLRRRILKLLVLGFVGLTVLIAVALTIPAIRDVFLVRFSLQQDYDLGETGRFGNQLRSIPLLLEAVNGFGPLQFRNHFAQEDPHSVYLNAFASYGWIGGFAYATLMVTTIWVGWWLVFRRTPFQSDAIAVWSTLFVQILQGFQIDTDHWRHFFLLLGLLWGLAAATRRFGVEAGNTRPLWRSATQALGAVRR